MSGKKQSIMKKSQRLLSLLVLLGVVDIDNYYAISVHRNQLHFQGYMRDGELGKWTKFLKSSKEPMRYDSQQKWFMGKRRIAGISLEVTLT